MLARLLQFTTLMSLVVSATWLTLMWSRHPTWAVVGSVLSLVVFVPVLGLEFLVAWRVNRRDPAPRASLWQWAKAWPAEVITMAKVFFWCQPFAWNAVPDQLDDAFSHRGRRGVVLIHGFVCNRGLWTPWLRSLKRDRRAVVAVNLQPVFGSIDGYAPLVDQAITQVTQATGMPPLVVCHSMGGLAVRAWLASGRGHGAARAPYRDDRHAAPWHLARPLCPGAQCPPNASEQPLAGSA